jgi:hypothetical protein
MPPARDVLQAPRESGYMTHGGRGWHPGSTGGVGLQLEYLVVVDACQHHHAGLHALGVPISVSGRAPSTGMMCSLSAHSWLTRTLWVTSCFGSQISENAARVTLPGSRRRRAVLGPSARPEPGLAVEQFSGDVQVTGDTHTVAEPTRLSKPAGFEEQNYDQGRSLTEP